MAEKFSGGGRAVRLGRAEIRAGNPGIRSIASGQFSASAVASRVAFNPRDVGVNRFTGGRDLTAASRTAGQAYNSAAIEIGARRALGQATPSLSTVRRQIAQQFGLRPSQVRINR